MGGLEGDSLAQIAQRVFEGLVGQAMHQVEIEVIEPGLASHAGGAHRLVTVMDPAQRF